MKSSLSLIPHFSFIALHFCQNHVIYNLKCAFFSFINRCHHLLNHCQLEKHSKNRRVTQPYPLEPTHILHKDTLIFGFERCI